jgi:hypothetical protein
VTPRFLEPLESEEEGNTILRKTGNYLPFDTAYHPPKIGYPNTADCCMFGLNTSTVSRDGCQQILYSRGGISQRSEATTK